MPHKWPKDPKCKFSIVSSIQAIDGKEVSFRDGQKYRADSIIMCTGYLHSFPFIEDDIRLEQSTNSAWINDLWKGVIWNHNPNLTYLGMQT